MNIFFSSSLANAMYLYDVFFCWCLWEIFFLFQEIKSMHPRVRDAGWACYLVHNITHEKFLVGFRGFLPSFMMKYPDKGQTKVYQSTCVVHSIFICCTHICLFLFYYIKRPPKTSCVWVTSRLGFFSDACSAPLIARELLWNVKRKWTFFPWVSDSWKESFDLNGKNAYFVWKRQDWVQACLPIIVKKTNEKCQSKVAFEKVFIWQSKTVGCTSMVLLVNGRLMGSSNDGLLVRLEGMDEWYK